jgi:hypothetical protein
MKLFAAITIGVMLMGCAKPKTTEVSVSGNQLPPILLERCYQLSDGNYIFNPNEKVVAGIGTTCFKAFQDYKTSIDHAPVRNAI